MVIFGKTGKLEKIVNFGILGEKWPKMGKTQKWPKMVFFEKMVIFGFFRFFEKMVIFDEI